MEYTKLGNTGMDISKICLGCMGFGDVTASGWHVDEEESRSVIKRALDLGINFFDTANIYAGGRSEEILGRALNDFANRDEMVVATKVFFNKLGDKISGVGLSRKAIMAEADKSLKRLGMDYIDLYIIHRWDMNTPIEETLSALHDLVKVGKVRYLGASAMYAFQFQKALYTADKHGYSKFVSMQNHYNLIYREDERDMLPLCLEEKIASTPYSPLASGRLSRPRTESTKRSEVDGMAKLKYDSTIESDDVVIGRVIEIAEKRGVSRTQVALAWLLHKPPVVAPVIGATKIAHLEDSVGAVSVSLSDEEIAYLEEAYVPHKIVGPSSHGMQKHHSLT